MHSFFFYDWAVSWVLQVYSKSPWRAKNLGQFQLPFCILRCAKGHIDTVVMVTTLTTGMFVLFLRFACYVMRWHQKEVNQVAEWQPFLGFIFLLCFIRLLTFSHELLNDSAVHMTGPCQYALYCLLFVQHNKEHGCCTCKKLVERRKTKTCSYHYSDEHAASLTTNQNGS